MAQWTLALLLALVTCSSASTSPIITPNGSTLELPAHKSPVTFELALVHIRSEKSTHSLMAEVARTPQQHMRGLMYRTAMPPDSAMLFVFSSDQTRGFWMYRTHLSLSIAYLDRQGVIVSIKNMEPCFERSPQQCRSEAKAYRPAVPYRYALEVNQGYFRQNAIAIGDQVQW
ncbi:hypothetical protein HNR37_002064 [Desulfurispira natronophila]|uniref:DUF192 domain-containing protein n=1 Tax=Desulfurispira natronophila TaxID=682562 RepID=A0A7W7Y5Z2_9BACT|nr:hypothetical protein [Desulfurispira natronophila]